MDRPPIRLGARAQCALGSNFSGVWYGTAQSAKGGGEWLTALEAVRVLSRGRDGVSSTLERAYALSHDMSLFGFLSPFPPEIPGVSRTTAQHRHTVGFKREAFDI